MFHTKHVIFAYSSMQKLQSFFKVYLRLLRFVLNVPRFHVLQQYLRIPGVQQLHADLARPVKWIEKQKIVITCRPQYQPCKMEG